MNKKRGYVVSGYDETCGVAVVALSTNTAKALAVKAGEFLGDEWIDIKSRWIRDADITGLPIGVVLSYIEALKRGFFAYIEGVCDRCGSEEHVEFYNNEVLCITCVEELEGETK